MDISVGKWNPNIFSSSRGGLRQGCPLSSLLFVVLVKILRSIKSENPLLVGIRLLPVKFLNHSQFADTRDRSVPYLTNQLPMSNITNLAT
jgi:hypothetical protein